MPRNIKNPGIFAADASTTIPAAPVAGTSYRNDATGLDNIRNGWPYSQIVDSAEFAQIMHQITSLLDLVDRTGVLQYKNDVDYDQGVAHVTGSDGVLYRSTVANGPGATVVDPVGDVTGTWVRAVPITGVPVGSVVMLAHDTVPVGYLKEDGAAVSRATYAALFTVLGTTYGAGDGSTTFNLPDSRGLFNRGWDEGGAVDPGRDIGSYQADEIKSHVHALGFNAILGSGDTEGGSGRVNPGTENTLATGGTETRPRNIARMYVIKY